MKMMSRLTKQMISGKLLIHAVLAFLTCKMGDDSISFPGLPVHLGQCTRNRASWTGVVWSWGCGVMTPAFMSSTVAGLVRLPTFMEVPRLLLSPLCHSLGL